MEYFIKCTGPHAAVFIKCGSKLNLSADNRIGRCGHCGCQMHIEFSERVVVKEDPPKHKEWVQQRLF